MLSLILATLISTNAHAGHESFGGGLCSYADIVCNSKDSKVELCLFKRSETQADLDVIVNGKLTSYAATKVPVPPHMMGAPLAYEGRDVKFSMIVDAGPREDGVVSYLTVDDQKISNKQLGCKFQDKK